MEKPTQNFTLGVWCQACHKIDKKFSNDLTRVLRGSVPSKFNPLLDGDNTLPIDPLDGVHLTLRIFFCERKSKICQKFSANSLVS